MSLGCPPSGSLSLALRSACQYAHEKGVVLCCAAGNDSGKVNAPANLPTTIAVAAVDRNKEKAYFTCHGSEVDFAAGGVATPADASLMMQLGAEGVFVGSGIFKSGDPAKRAQAIVKAVTNYQDAKLIAELSSGLGEAMVGINADEIRTIMEERGK